MLVKIYEYIGFCVHRRSYLLGSPVNSELPDPKNIKELRSLLGTLNFVRRFVPDYAEVTAPLVELTKKQYKQRRKFEKHWGTTQSEAVTRIKKLLSCPPVLHFPGCSEEFIVHMQVKQESEHS